MKRLFIIVITLVSLVCAADAQTRVIDANDKSPVSAASVLDAAGNMVGYTFADGTLSEIPESEYPITVRSLGYEQLVIDSAEEKVWEMTPISYELEEVVIVPVERNVMKQTFYAREYFSMNTKTDTATFFTEHMGLRYVPAKKGVKVRGSSSYRVIENRSYGRYMLFGKDSIVSDADAEFPSMISVLDFSFDEIKVPESFKEQDGGSKLYEKKGKSGLSLVLKQNSQVFTITKDGLADEKDHSISIWPLKVLGFGMDINQLYATQTYRVNDEGSYMHKDLLESGFVMEADGTGRMFRKMMKSEEPIVIRVMVELYIVDRDFLTKEEAKLERKNRPSHMEFVIPDNVPPLNEATRRMIERAKKESACKGNK